MFTLLILAIVFYLYKTGDLQRFLRKLGSPDPVNDHSARQIIDLRYAAGKISEEEYIKLKNLL